MNEQRKSYRTMINTIALYSNGSYDVRDMWNMTLPHIEEIQDVIVDKNKKESDATKAASGRTTKTF
jgi:hypothetical protein